MQNITLTELMNVSGQLRIDQDKDNAFWIDPTNNLIGGKFKKPSHPSTKTFEITPKCSSKSSNGRVANTNDILKDCGVEYAGI